MDEIKILLELIAGIPNAAMWVIAIIYFYKVTIIGSIYATIRFVVYKVHDAYVSRLNAPAECGSALKAVCISSSVSDSLIKQIWRVRDGGEYIHSSDVTWLSKAISAQIARDRESGKETTRT